MSTCVAGAGGSAAGPRPPPQVPRTIREAEQLDLRGLPPEQLPDVVVEAEAEFARKRGWERVFPAEKDPCRCVGLMVALLAVLVAALGCRRKLLPLLLFQRSPVEFVPL